MASFKTFSDYMNVRMKPKDPGELFPEQPKPPAAEGQTGEVAPYKGNGEDAPLQKPEKGGLAAANPGKVSKFGSIWTKTESFIEKTKNMSPREFASYMMEQCSLCDGDADSIPMVTAYAPGKFHPHPNEAIKYVVVLANKNDNLMNQLLDEMGSGEGGMSKILGKIFDRPKAWEHLSDILSDPDAGPDRANALVRAMHDGYVKLKDEPVIEAVGPPLEDLDDEDHDLGNSTGEEDPDSEPSASTNANSNADEDEDMEPEMDDQEQAPENPGMPAPPKKKKKLAFNHMIDSMKNYEPMANYMRAD